MKTRLWIPDYLKGWAVIIMIQGHIMETWIRQDILETSTGGVIRLINQIPAAPLFMLIMGFLAFYTRASSSKLFLRGLKVFFWGLLLNIGMNFHYLVQILSGRVVGNIWHSILGADILFLAGISIAFMGLIRMLPMSWWWSLGLSLAIALAAPALTQTLDQVHPGSYLFALIASTASWSYFPVFPWLAYPLAGFALAGLLGNTKLESTQKEIRMLATILLLGIGSVGFILGWNDLKELSSYYHHGLAVYLWTLSFSAGVSLLLLFFPNLSKGGFSAWLQFAGRFLTRYYVIQWLIIGNLASFFYQQLGIWAYFVGFLLVSALTTGLVYLLKDRTFKL